VHDMYVTKDFDRLVKYYSLRFVKKWSVSYTHRYTLKNLWVEIKKEEISSI
jgi:hypothetical protein